MNRDPHLPPPEVCDWLIEQNWSELTRRTAIIYSEKHSAGTNLAELFSFSFAYADIGAFQKSRLFLPTEALEVLKADQRARREAIERKRAAMEADELERKSQREEDRVDEDSELNLLRKVLAEAEKAEHSAIATIGVFATAAVIMVSQAFNLAYQPDEAEEAQP